MAKLLKVSEIYKQIEANLSQYDVKLINEADSWFDDEGEEIRVFKCELRGQKVLAELFTDTNLIDVYFEKTHEDIFNSVLVSIQDKVA